MRYTYEFKKQCITMYRQGQYPKTPKGISKIKFHQKVREWVRMEEACGSEVLKHKAQNRV